MRVVRAIYFIAVYVKGGVRSPRCVWVYLGCMFLFLLVGFHLRVMDEVKVLYDQIESTFRGKSWHGPNMIQVLEGVSVDKAKLRPLSERHSI